MVNKKKLAQYNSSVWAEATSDWLERKQDHNYRSVLVHPAIRKAVLNVNLITGIIADIGCGDGSEAKTIVEAVRNAKNVQDGLDWPENTHPKTRSLQYFGYDPNAKFIEMARNTYEGDHLPVSIHCSFHSGNIEDFVQENDLEDNCDLVTSLFVLQDIPDYENHIALLAKCARSGGISLAVVVHPGFGRAMLEKDAFESYKEPWDEQFYGKYPIVEESRPPFFVPYFHRPLQYYTYVFEKKFVIEGINSLQPDEAQMSKCITERISPFYPHEHNVYWPEIISMPSSVLIKARKK